MRDDTAADGAVRGSRARDVGVRIEAVTVSFGRTRVLRDIDLEIHAGEFFTLLGPSGCGKTTLLRLIAGFTTAQTGRVLIADRDVTGLPPWRRNVGMVFQSYALWPHMTARKNVAFGLEERKIPRREIARRVEAALDLVGLLALADRRPSELSGGQQQRVALARTIVVEPDVLLLDEPLSNLDAKLRVQMRQELHDLQRKLSLTTIFVTHDQEEANSTADRIAVMEAGVVQQVGTPTTLYDHPANRFVAGFLGSANVLDGELSEVGGQSVFRASDGITIPMTPDQRASVRPGRGGPTSIMFRPQNVTITTATGNIPPGVISMLATVQRREFLGNAVRYAAAVGGHVILVEDEHRRGEAPLDLGTAVQLRVPADQVMLLSG